MLKTNRKRGGFVPKASELNQINSLIQHTSVDEYDQPPGEGAQRLQTWPHLYPFECIIDGANDADDKVRIGASRGNAEYYVKDLITFWDSSGEVVLQKTSAETATVTANGWLYYDIDGSGGSGSMTASDATFSFSTSLPTSSGTTVKYVVAYAEWDSTNSRIKALQQLQFSPIYCGVCT